MSIHDDATLQNAQNQGDRDLSAFVGSGEGGVYAFATYTYTNLVGAGNPNVYKLVKYGAEIQKWHFIYFGYNRNTRRAFAFVEFEGRREEADFPTTNHYLARNLYLYVAKDKFYPTYSGKLSNLKMVLCNGAFDPKFPSDPKPPVTPEVPPKPEPEPTCVEGTA